MGFTKLDEGILRSSIMAEDPATFKVWITLLAACRQDGVADVSAVFLASVCHMDIRTIHRALKKLEDTDPDSRTTLDEGRRIKRVDGGFEIINYFKYREKSISEIEAERKRRQREKDDVRDSPGHSGTVLRRSASASSSVFIKEGVWGGITEKDMETWRTAFPACNIEAELKKMASWLVANPTKRKSNYRRFVHNWLTKAQDQGGTRGAPQKSWLETTKVKDDDYR